MNDKTGGGRGPRRAAAALAAAAAVAAAAAACGGGASSYTTAPTYAQVLALAQCMRGHGVPDFPDPNASGSYSLGPNGSLEGAGGSSADINSKQVQAAYGDCRHLVPGGPSISRLEQIEQQEQQRQEQELPQLLRFSQCMRGHGVQNFPDLGGSRQSPAPGNGAAIDPNSPQFQAAWRACRHLLPPGAQLSINTNRSTP
jgi:hypothetical protein